MSQRITTQATYMNGVRMYWVAAYVDGVNVRDTIVYPLELPDALRRMRTSILFWTKPEARATLQKPKRRH